ncbi:hypothetical protein ACQP1G_03490 [Nocardia sp. CA-107356]|uniref:hypothetical protein n=1 Tax=Nocardia sp. CA-107356 TaxID=3239972 RepID=UPI003D8A3710
MNQAITKPSAQIALAARKTFPVPQAKAYRSDRRGGGQKSARLRQPVDALI